MKYFFVSLLLTASLVFQAQTNIPAGNLSGTLTLSGSPYHIQGHVMIPPNSILKINPGVVIEFQGHYKLNVQGQLLAEGTSSDSIYFRVPTTLISSGWWGVRFELTSVLQDSSHLSFCKIQYGKANGNGDDMCGGGIFLKNFSKVSIKNCRLSNNGAFYGGGIFMHYSSPLIQSNAIVSNTLLIGFGGIGGGGICCDSVSNPVVHKNLISNNYIPFSGYGAGIHCDNSSPTITSNTISLNAGDLEGAGVSMLNYSSPLIQQNLITANTGPSGSGMFCYSGSKPIIIQNIISYNVSTAGGGFQAYGGGLYITGAGTFPEVIQNEIHHNYALNRGGGLEVLLSEASVRDNTIHSNSSGAGGGVSIIAGGVNYFSGNSILNNNAYIGGGISLASTAYNCILSNNLIANNTSNENGGGIHCDGMSPLISNCTIVNNQANTIPSQTTAVYGGGGLYCASACNATLTNCIVYGNNTGSGNGHQFYLDDNASDPPIYHSLIQNGTSGFFTNGSLYSGTYSNNIIANPLFVAPSITTGTNSAALSANWNLQNTSPCINSGKIDTTGLFLPNNDLAGNMRVKAIIDMGVYESGSCAGFIIDTTVTQTGILLSANAGASYQWLSCGSGYSPIFGATSNTFIPLNNGSYAVMISSSGCADTSSCFNVSTVGIKNQLTNSTIKLFPNPSSSLITIDQMPVGTKVIEVYTTDARLIFSSQTTQTSQVLKLEEKGMYLIKIQFENSLEIKKVLIE